MRRVIKKIDFLDLSTGLKIEINSAIPLCPGRKVLVQTQRAKDLKFYIMLEVIEQRQENYIGKVLGPEGYHGDRDVIYPGKYLKFEFDGMTLDDEVWFEKKNAANVF